MFWNYLKVAWRNLLRHPLYAAINVVGLGIAISFCLLAFLFARYEWTYDGFHENADRIYRVYAEFEGRRPLEETPRALGPALSESFPYIRSVRMDTEARQILHQGQKTRASVLRADPEILDIFSFPLIKGDPATVLEAPGDVVITETMAERLFPGGDPIGKTISVQDVKGIWYAPIGETTFSPGSPGRSSESTDAFSVRQRPQELTVTGVIEAIPENSSIRFDFLAPLTPTVQNWGWGLGVVATFILLPDHLTQAEAERRLEALSFPWPRSQGQGQLKLQALTDIYFDSGSLGLYNVGNPVYSFLLGSIAMLVMIVAAVNYTSLSVGLSFARAREVGIRKVAGGLRTQLARQFLSESILLTLVALALGLALAELFLPGFNSLVNRQFAHSDLVDSGSFAFLFVMVLVVGIVAGGYPALFTSGFLWADALKGRLKVGRMGYFSRALVVFQLAISTALVTCMTIASTQMSILKSKPLGFEPSHVVVVRLSGISRKMQLAKVFEEAIRPHQSILQTTRTSFGIGNSPRHSTHLNWKGTTLEDVEIFFCDPRFLETMECGLTAGRNFDRESDPETSVIINESMARRLGSEVPLGEMIRLENKEMTVIGIVRNFHYRSLHHAIGPAVLRLPQASSSGRHVWDRRYQLMIRIRPENVFGTLDFIREKWAEIVPHIPISYSFLDAQIDFQYREERRWYRIAGYATFFAVFIACLGAFGLTSLTVARRTKEIGIRKVVGAPTIRIVSLLAREYVFLVGIAAMIASPATYLASERWLRDFAYRVDPGLGTFLLGGLLMLLTVFLAVSLQVTRAARANPVDALRYE